MDEKQNTVPSGVALPYYLSPYNQSIFDASKLYLPIFRNSSDNSVDLSTYGIERIINNQKNSN
jgi:hypothetical protein